ncbi:NAD-glutamate dehydrogenase [Pseudonocardia sp.]|uniref:NAD-glutamate dehydrogenase n=1 Tax=Pseudonocardia sp. TaxID=60912 RepID=UPI003D0EFB0B
MSRATGDAPVEDPPGEPATDPLPGELHRLYARHAAAAVVGFDDPGGALDAAARAHLRLAAHRATGTAVIDIHGDPGTDVTGDVEEAAGAATVVDLVTDETPALVPSVLAGIGRVGRQVHHVVHAMVVVRRDPDGRLRDVDAAADPGDPPTGALVEAWIRLQLDPAAPEEGEDLGSELDEVLAAVHHVAADAHRLTDTVRTVAAELAGAGATPERDDAARLLRWLADGHFDFLGYRRYEAAAATLRAVPGSGLGVLRHNGFRDGIPDVVGDRPLVVLTRADVPSRVLRPEYPYDVVIGILDDDGHTVGEHRFLGLFTTAALHEHVLDTPIVEARVRAAIHRAGVPVESWSGQQLLDVLSRFPREELFWAGEQALHETAAGVLTLAHDRRLLLTVHAEPYGRFLSCLVHLPHDRYSPQARSAMQRVLLRELDGWRVDHDVTVGETGPVQVHFTVHVGPAAPPPDQERLRAQLAAAILTWDDWVIDAAGRDAEQIAEYLPGLPQGYRDDVDPVRAVADLRRVRDLGVDPHLELAGEPDDLHFRLVVAGAPVSLSAVLPVLQSLGVDVLDERSYEIVRPDGVGCRLYDFGLVADAATRLTLSGRGGQAARDRFCAAFRAAWSGAAETDRFNALVLHAGLGWREVAVLRAYARYASQLGGPFGRRYVADILLAHPDAAQALASLFRARFDPAPPTATRERRSAEALATATALIDEVTSLDADRILRGHLSMLMATSRTNWFQDRPYFSFKIDPGAVPDMPSPRPRFEIFVYSPRVEGVHLRFGPVARGGLRWSDRPQDYRTEILGLVKAQMVKNAVIVPVGAKGGFVVAAPAPDPAEAEACYRIFISGLLDVTDNRVDGATVAPPDVVRHDGDDSYLVVAADKGTARFSDVANEVAAGYGFWLGDAFASGGSVGYDHKAMGITARGAWESVRRHFRELGVDTQNQDFSVVGIGDMSGDVFGNGMLLSPHIRLVAAFDHRHVFVDPDPDPAAGWAERARLFALARSSWDDYDRAAISPGGGVWPRTAKSVPVAPPLRAALGLPPDVERLSPPELVRAILSAPVDLLWNGGIGTYVKAATESHGEAGDKANDAVRVDGRTLRVRVVGEGGNLGLTQRGRIEFARAGGRINTDAIDNSAGVDCSDHEVNIKILLDRLVTAGQLDRPGRDTLLAEMTDEVAELVLADNTDQNAALGIARARAADTLPVHARMIDALATRAGLDRDLEALPHPEEIDERIAAGHGLASPELAVLLPHTKLDLKAAVLRTDLPERPEFAQRLPGYFPRPLRERFPAAVAAHPLRREIVATMLVNELVDRAGISFVHRLGEDAAAGADDAVRAFRVAVTVFDLPQLWARVAALPGTVPTAALDAIAVATRRLVDAAARWLLAYRPRPLDVPAEIDRFAAAVQRLLPELGSLLRGAEATAAADRAAALAGHGVPAALADRVAALAAAHGLLDVVEVAAPAHQLPIEEIARLWFTLSERSAGRVTGG